MTVDTARALASARTILATRFPGADFAFVAGLAVRGEGRSGAAAGIDIVVLYRVRPAAYREALILEGVPVEIFVHDRSTLAWFVERDVARGRPGILAMVAEGEIIGRKTLEARALQAKAIARLAAGPPPMSAREQESLRFAITNALDDLRAARDPAEITAIGAMLYPALAGLSLRGRGHWNGAGKWTARLLARAEPDLAVRYQRAFADLFGRHEAGAVLTLGVQELERLGGALFAGFRRDASISDRIDERSPLAAGKDRV